MNKVKEQSGFTIIELMVALLIGLLLMAGILSVFVASKRSYSTRDGMSVMQENGRVAVKRLQRGLSPAGYPTYQDIVPIVFEEGRYGSIEASNDGDAAPGDRVTIVHRAAGAYAEDCLGNPGVINGMIVNSYFVDDGRASLMCEGSGGQTQPLAEGVESMHVLYGMDDDGDGYADHYLDAAAASADIDKSLSVVSIQVSLLVNSQELARDAASTETYTLLGEDVVTANDQLQRRVFTTTVPLRNRIPFCEDCT